MSPSKQPIVLKLEKRWQGEIYESGEFALDELCSECVEGYVWYEGEGSPCLLCNGLGFLPTEIGKQLLGFMFRHKDWRPEPPVNALGEILGTYFSTSGHGWEVKVIGSTNLEGAYYSTRSGEPS